MRPRTIDDLPCRDCTDPCAADVRHAVALADGIVNEKFCSPFSKLPVGCCRIHSSTIPTDVRFANRAS